MMKKSVLIAGLFMILPAGFPRAQTPLVDENFANSTGTLTSVNTNWTEYSTGSVDIEEVSGSLTYSGYPSSGIGNKIVLNGGASGRSGVIHSFTTQSTDGTSVYFSMLLKVTSTNDMDTNISGGDPFCNLTTSSTSTKRAYIYVRQGADSTKFSVGIAKSSSSSLSWYSTELDVGSTYLIVASYGFVSGSGNDEVRLWINPALSGSEPAEDVLVNSGADASDIENIQFLQNQFSGDMEVDGVRVATTWSAAPLPVELSEFSGNFSGGKVLLHWVTETEINNYGFEIERSIPGENSRWKNIGFVRGKGNSNTPTIYNFTDNFSSPGSYIYRLRQIDNDGKIKYSGKARIIIPGAGKLVLKQNYPNPFNPVTTIGFTVPVRGEVSIDIFDPLGRLVRSLPKSVKEAGTYEVKFNAAGLNSGIYFYRVKSGGRAEVMKMILIK